jgi:hypothetical protein
MAGTLVNAPGFGGYAWMVMHLGRIKGGPERHSQQGSQIVSPLSPDCSGT